MKSASLSALHAGVILRLQQRLAERVGFEAALFGPEAVRYAVRSRMSALSVTSVSEYDHLITDSDEEWTELLGTLLVSETWFYREQDTFKNLAELVTNRWAPANPDRSLRLLSVPCASGEEPFTMVMALLDAGFPLHRLQLDAADLNGPALAQARTGVYGSRSFRTADLSFRERHFQAVRGGFLLHEPLRNSVRFLHGNLLQNDFLGSGRTYHIVFCRNLLIYLHDAARSQALAKLKSLLVPDGFLFVSVTEQLLARDYGFVPQGPGLTVPLAWSGKGESSVSKITSAGAFRPVSALGPLLPSRLGHTPVCDSSVRLKLSPVRRDESQLHGSRDALEEARRLADAGKLKQAIAICRAGLRDGNTCAGAYYLLGLLREASGEPGAAEYYRKALYLEPNHHDALMHMALLAHNRGDRTAARLFRARAERIQQCQPQP